MKNISIHSFHIPVMGLSYTIDTPLRVAHYGIDSVVSIVDDELAEKMNAYYSNLFRIPFNAVTEKMSDYRARRITAYLNLMDRLVNQQFKSFCDELSRNKKELEKFISMLSDKSEIVRSLQGLSADNFLKRAKAIVSKHLSPGAIDVNIMTKVDKTNFKNKVALPPEFNDAHAVLRGYANSTLNSSLVLSAGMNPSLYSYIATFGDFFPDSNGLLKKRIILKVSDFRSALIQGSFLAKKGIWVSEYRIESGLNCGGHAFATDGLLLGSILSEFKVRKNELTESVYNLWVKALADTEYYVPPNPPSVRITVQGGVGTAEEHEFLLNHFQVDSVGWGSPFLLVPEATCTDKETRELLAKAEEKDLYRSDISPLGVPFNTVAGTTNEFYKNRRIKANRVGSSCPKKLLALNVEYGEEGICTASRKFQEIKLKELDGESSDVLTLNRNKEAILNKSCLCVGLANAAYLEKDIAIKGEQQGVVVCPGPNLAYFNKEVSLQEMVRHIYGYTSILAEGYRPHMFIKELQLYYEYLKQELSSISGNVTRAQVKKWQSFMQNMQEGIAYYEALFRDTNFFKQGKQDIMNNLALYKLKLKELIIPAL
jgi:hypothetical protein